MSSKTKDFLAAWPVVIFCLLWLSFSVGTKLWPADFWLDVRSVKAGPARAGQPVPVVADRTIKRAFYGHWSVSVKRVERWGLSAFCTAEGSSWYTPDAALPPAATMAWWTNGTCIALPEGNYLIDTTWRIRPSLGFLPEKTVTARSNIFEVAP